MDTLAFSNVPVNGIDFKGALSAVRGPLHYTPQEEAKPQCPLK